MLKNLLERSIPHIVLDPQSLDDIADDLLTVGEAAESKKRLQIIKLEYYNIYYEMKKRAATVTTNPLLYWEWWPKPVFTPDVLTG